MANYHKPPNYCAVHAHHFGDEGCAWCMGERPPLPGWDLPDYGKEALVEAQMEGKPLPAPPPVFDLHDGVSPRGRRLGKANERQHGGDHYKRFKYEHWDFVCDTGQPYLIGCATKYAARWRNKAGKLDLEKMLHYIDKAEERDIEMPQIFTEATLTKFVRQIPDGNDRALVVSIMLNDWDTTRTIAKFLLEDDPA